MNGWEWVIWGYTFALVGIGAYVVSVVLRTKAVQQRLTDVSPSGEVE